MKTRNKNDEIHWSTLMISAQRGSESDYRQLLSELGDAIAAYLRSRFGYFDVLEDCVQESLMGIHKARDTYEASRLFRPWLFAIVNYKTIDVLRKRDKYHNVVNEQVAKQQELLSIDESHCDHKEKKIEQMQVFGQLLMALSHSHREAVLLTKLQGLSMKEAANHLDISESAMKVRVHRALGALKQLLESEKYINL